MWNQAETNKNSEIQKYAIEVPVTVMLIYKPLKKPRLEMPSFNPEDCL